MPPFGLEYDTNTAEDRMHLYKTYTEFTTFARKRENLQFSGFLTDLVKN